MYRFVIMLIAHVLQTFFNVEDFAVLPRKVTFKDIRNHVRVTGTVTRSFAK